MVQNLKNNVNENISGCTGCSVCKKVCSKNAINIKLNKHGFYEAEIDKKLCINCGLCKKVCYKFINENKNINQFNIKNSIPYLSYSKDKKIRYKSSSGGIGREISNYGISNNYSICGVKYNYNLNRAEHTIVDRKKDLDIITGSKYIPSYTIEAFSKLDKDKKYIVFGTPCQIYGLRKYIELKKLKILYL